MQGTATTVINDENFLSTNYDYTKIFIWDNKGAQRTFLNNTGATASFAPGTLLALKSDTNQWVPLLSTNTNNAENIPAAILRTPISDLNDSATVDDVSGVISGDVARDKVVFQSTDNYETVIAEGNNRSIELLLNYLGIVVRESRSLTEFDNA